MISFETCFVSVITGKIGISLGKLFNIGAIVRFV